MDQKQFVSELSKLRPASTFLSVLGYRSASSEVADYSIIFHMSYENALKKSLAIMEGFNPSNDLEEKAKASLVTSFSTSLDKISTSSIEDIDDAYTRFFDKETGDYIKGIKVHTETNVLHLYGLVNYKRVIMPGTFKTSNRQELTVVKDNLRKMCPVSKFRQFIMDPAHVKSISVEKISLNPPQNGL